MTPRNIMQWPEGRVKIEWRDPDSDWRNYTILTWNDTLRMVKLKGEPDDDGSPFDGGDFWAHLSDIKCIEERK